MSPFTDYTKPNLECNITNYSNDKMYQESMQKGNLPGSTTRNTKGVKYIKSYVKKVNEKEYYIAEGAVVPERSKKNKTHS